MLRVKIYTQTYNYYIDDVTSYDNAIKVLSKRLGYNPHIYKICHVDEYEEELEVITGDELDNYLSHFYQINPDFTDDCFFTDPKADRRKIAHKIIAGESDD